MVKPVTWSTLSAWSFITRALLSSIATAVTAVVKLRVWLPCLTFLSPQWSVFRTQRCTRRARRWLVVPWSRLSAAASLPCPMSPGSSGGEAEVGAVEEWTSGCVWRYWADGFLSTQLLIGENQAAGRVDFMTAQTRYIFPECEPDSGHKI